MAGKNKARVNVKMVSTEGTGEFYTTSVNHRNMESKKLTLKKYDKKLKKAVLFKEEKLK
jgi:large subunit ribosomal protein L33